MIQPIGIAGRLLLAFACIATLSLASGFVGWWKLHDVDKAQKSVVEQAMPAAADAKIVAEISKRIADRIPLLRRATSQSTRRLEAQALSLQAIELNDVLSRLGGFGFNDINQDDLQNMSNLLIGALGKLDKLIARRITLDERLSQAVHTSLDAAKNLSDMSETLVSNAASGTTAVISNLYELVESEERVGDALNALDRLLEKDVFTMERMFELRLRSSQIGLLLNQIEQAGTPEEVADIEASYLRNLRILDRRANGIADPTRQILDNPGIADQANRLRYGQKFHRLHGDTVMDERQQRLLAPPWGHRLFLPGSRRRENRIARQPSTRHRQVHHFRYRAHVQACNVPATGVQRIDLIDHQSLCIPPSGLTQTQPTGDDATQDFTGAAAQGKGW